MNNSFTKTKATEIAKILLNIPIIHVYGKIANLPWEDTDFFLNYKEINIKSYMDLAKNINVIYSNRVDEERITKAKKLINDAERIFFLGFGYANENMEILNIADNINRNQKIYGTAKDLTKNEILKIKSYFSKTHKIDNPYLIIEDCDCLTLLRNYLYSK